MRDVILKAVANPPKLFWAPVLPAALNGGLQMPFMFIAMGIWQSNPLIFVISLVTGHMIAIALGARDPHLSAMIRAFGAANYTSKNLYSVKGRKFEP